MCGSECGFGSVKQDIEQEGFDQVEASWTPVTFKIKAIQIGNQFANRLTEENSQLTMARETDKSSIDKMMEIMISMRLEDQKRKREREQKRDAEQLDREDRIEREKKEIKERRERDKREQTE